MPVSVRTGETERTWFRSERFFHTDQGWYFTTRENTQEGPFQSRREAENELDYYIGHRVAWGYLEDRQPDQASSIH